MELEKEQVLDYYELEEELKQLGALASASEAHGILIGQLAGGLELDTMMWLQQFLLAVGAKSEPSGESANWLSHLLGFSRESLLAEDFSFQPLLPDDDDPLSLRLNRISEWCSGFLAGFGSAGDHEGRELDEEVASALKDLAAICQVETELTDESLEQAESDFFSLNEFVRMAALLVYTEFGLARDESVCETDSGDDKSNPTLH